MKQARALTFDAATPLIGESITSREGVMARQVIIEEFGGPRNMKLVDVELGEPGPGEVRIRHEAIGLNFIDVYFRTGVYPMELPGGIGMEAAGVIGTKTS